MPNGNYQYDPSQFGITGMSPGYLQSIMEDIKRRGRQTYGEVTARGTAAGMEYDEPTMGIRQQAAISGTQREMGQTVGGFAFESYERRQQREHEMALARLRLPSIGRGYRPPTQYGRVPSLGGGPALGGGDPMAGAGGTPVPMMALAKRVESAYRPPVAREAYATPWHGR